jgi:hypothetical protein
VSPGVGVLPLACCAACPVFLGRGRGWGVAVRPLGVRTGRGWSGRFSGRAAGRGQQGQPFLLAVPVLVALITA